MKIAVTANGPNLDARVGHRFGTSPYIIFVDPETMIFEVEPNPGTADGLAAGIQLVVLAISKNIDAVLTDFASRLPGSTIVAKAWPLQPRQARLNGERTGPVEAAELKSWYIDLKTV